MADYAPTPNASRLLSGWAIIKAQPWILALVTWLPPLLFLLILSIFATSTPTKLPIGVVNLDHSQAARAFERQLNASPGLHIVSAFPDVTAGTQALQNAEVLAIVIIPNNFARDLTLSISPTITAFYNNQYLLAGKFINSALMSASLELAAKQSVMLNISHGLATPKAEAAAAPIQPQITALFNSNMSYARFLVTAIAPAMWQIFIIIATVLTLCYRLESAPISSHFSDRVYTLSAALAPVTLLLLLQGLLMLLLFYVFLGWSEVANLFWLLIGLLLMLLAIQAMAILIVAVVKDKVKAMSISAAYLAPAFAFMGMTFPRSEMNTFAWLWGGLMPSTHYMKLQVDVADHGASVAILLQSICALTLFLIVFPVAVKLLPTHLKTQSVLRSNR